MTTSCYSMLPNGEPTELNEFRVFNLEALEKTYIGKHLNDEVYAHFLAITKK